MGCALLFYAIWRMIKPMNEMPVLSVSEISLSLKSCVEQVFSDVRVRGEIFQLKRATSGHTYFSLKDTDSVLGAVCWRGIGKESAAALQEGLEVICHGKLSVYPGRSSYQIIVDKVEPAGEGALLKLLKERKEKLEKEGLFDAARKKQIPYLPTTIGVITSPTGAVIRDILHRLKERFPVSVLLWGVAVQGEGAAEQIAGAVEGFNRLPETGDVRRPDVLIVARGGGSLEDLWCFNEEIVVRAVAASHIPVISAVGHETDTTLIDYAADLRAPTPTGAAEKAVPVRSELLVDVIGLKGRLLDSVIRLIENYKDKVKALVAQMPPLPRVLETLMQRLDDLSERLHNAFRFYFEQLKNNVLSMGRLLESYSYTSVLKRGFAVVLTDREKVVSSVAQASGQSALQIVYYTNLTKFFERITNVLHKGFLFQHSVLDNLKRPICSLFLHTRVNSVEKFGNVVGYQCCSVWTFVKHFHQHRSIFCTRNLYVVIVFVV